MEQQPKKFDISTFKKAQEEMIAKNESAWKNSYFNIETRRRYNYSPEEIQTIINSGSLVEQQMLSRAYFDRDGLYKRIIIYYATILTYSGLLIPNPSFGKKLSTPHISKRYYAALDYVDKIGLPELLTRISIYALINGSYYGLIQNLSKEELTLIDLPATYCRSRYVDIHGNDIVEFDVTYFNTIVDPDMRQEALNTYPKVVKDFYNRWKKGKEKTSWMKIPADIGVCFPFFDDGRPLFLNVIPATIQYDDAVDTERERELEEIRKIIVQKIPHMTDASLLFEPQEAEEIHKGTVGMLKGNPNISVLTTYADVDAIVSKTSNENVSASLDRMLQNVYSKAGVSSQIFAPLGSQVLLISITNDMSLMMILGNKYSRFLTKVLNLLFSNSNITFKYTILPISYYNRSDYITDALKLAQNGYSFLLPAVGTGMSQRELISIKELENDVLKLPEVLIPLSSSYTQSNKEVGAPEKRPEEKSDKTIQNENAIDHQGQGGSE